MIRAFEGFDVPPPGWQLPRFNSFLPDKDGVVWGPYKQRITTTVDISRKNPKGTLQPFAGVSLKSYRWGMGPKFVAEVYSAFVKGYPCIYYVFQHVGKEKEPPLVRLFLFPTLGRWQYEERDDFKGMFTMQIEVDHRTQPTTVEAYQITKVEEYKSAMAMDWMGWGATCGYRDPSIFHVFYGDKKVATVTESWYNQFGKPDIGDWVVVWETGMVTFRKDESFQKEFTLKEGYRYSTAWKPLFT